MTNNPMGYTTEGLLKILHALDKSWYDCCIDPSFRFTRSQIALEVYDRKCVPNICDKRGHVWRLSADGGATYEFAEFDSLTADKLYIYIKEMIRAHGRNIEIMPCSVCDAPIVDCLLEDRN